MDTPTNWIISKKNTRVGLCPESTMYYPEKQQREHRSCPSTVLMIFFEGVLFQTNRKEIFIIFQMLFSRWNVRIYFIFFSELNDLLEW